MKLTSCLAGFALLLGCSIVSAAEPPTAVNRFHVDLPEHRFAGELLPGLPFGINMALRPDAPDMEGRLKAMQRAGIKWGRQDFTWRRIEREPGVYDWAPYDRLVDAARRHGILLFGNLAYAPKFHDPRTPQGAEAYAAFARAAVERYRGKIDHWQIWNEPASTYPSGLGDLAVGSGSRSLAQRQPGILAAANE